ncbi:MAG TPA: pyridoxal phosphate-dependent aminotransferase [Terriglobales bacterium]|nr:pyridoxal phosphate-dependent aminotransferase [Terriglobales bacterium]
MFSRRTDWKLTPNRFTQAQQEAHGREVLDLTISNPTRAGLRYDEKAILISLSNPAALDYDPQPKGLLSARQAIADYYEQQIDPESLLLTTSTSEGYSFVFRLLCNPEDEVLVPKPSYPLFEFLADLQDVKLVPYPLLYDHGWQIDFPSLEKAVTPRTRAVVLVHPNNPTGSYVSKAERDALNRFCREQNLAILVDEVFLDYAHDGASHPSFASNKDVLTFTLSGISKISALPQMKLAWIAASGPAGQLHPALSRLEIIADTYLSLTAPVQLAAPVLLDQRKQIQPQLLDRVRTNLAELDRQLAQQKASERLAVEGGWYAILRVPATRSDEDLAIEILRQASVLVHPGHFYDFPRDGYLVLSLITQPGQFRDGIARLLKLLAA